MELGSTAPDGEPPLQKGEVIVFGEGKTGTVTRAYHLEDKYAVKTIGALQEIRGPNGTFFYFKASELRRAMPMPSQADQMGVEVQPPSKQPRVDGCFVGADVGLAIDGYFAGQRRFDGRVKWFSREKGFGKITANAPGLGEEVFVHKNQMQGGPDGHHAQAMIEGALVTYEVTQVDGKPCACAVQVEGITRALAQIDASPAVANNRVELLRRLLLSGLHVGHFQDKGVGKATMEDRVLARSGVTLEVLGASCKKAVCAFFGVFDGHSGPSCSEFVSTNLDRSVFDCLRHQSKRDVTSELAIRGALLAAFRTTEHNFFQYVNRLEGGAASAWVSAGSTACTACFFGPDEEGRLRLAVANAGDSRAVLGKKDGRAIRLSEDHQPNVPSERKRIEAEGASVTQVQGIWRIVLPSKKGLGQAGLSVSRGFGDLEYKNPSTIVSAVPDVSFFTLDLREDSFVVLGTDGIWNSLHDGEATRIAAAQLREAGDADTSASKMAATSKLAAQHVVEEAHRRDGSDDKTAMVIWFGDLPDASSAVFGGGAAAPARRAQQPMLAPAHARKAADNDMFASGEAKAQPKAELAELDEMFAEYAREMSQKRAR